MRNLNSIPREPGVYALVLELSKWFRSRVGSLGVVVLSPGTYVYVGIARGPGGLYARVRRHVAKEKRVRWHIDYLTTFDGARARAVVYAVTTRDVESDYARALWSLGLEPSVKGFGCSDKPSHTHLYSCRLGLGECIEICRRGLELLGLEPSVITL